MMCLDIDPPAAAAAAAAAAPRGGPDLLALRPIMKFSSSSSRNPRK
jgi:hypothetical protein